MPSLFYLSIIFPPTHPPQKAVAVIIPFYMWENQDLEK